MSTDRATLSDFTDGDDTAFIYKRDARMPAAHDVGPDGTPACDADEQIDADDEDWNRVESEADLPPHVDRCGWCADDVQQSPNDGSKIVSKLEGMDPEDLGLSPMGERS